MTLNAADQPHSHGSGDDRPLQAEDRRDPEPKAVGAARIPRAAARVGAGGGWYMVAPKFGIFWTWKARPGNGGAVRGTALTKPGAKHAAERALRRAEQAGRATPNGSG